MNLNNDHSSHPSINHSNSSSTAAVFLMDSLKQARREDLVMHDVNAKDIKKTPESTLACHPKIASKIIFRSLKGSKHGWGPLGGHKRAILRVVENDRIQ